MSNGKITGTLYQFEGWTSGPLAGEGYFIALAFDDLDEKADNARVGLVPSSSGMELEELDSDMDGVFKITDKDNQKLVIEVFNDEQVTRFVYDLSGLT